MSIVKANTIENVAGTVSVLVEDIVTTSGIGTGQTWQDVSASRAINTEYTNNTSTPIMVSITATDHNATDYTLTVDSVVVAGTPRYPVSMSTIVPVGSKYELVCSSGLVIVSTWAELR